MAVRTFVKVDRNIIHSDVWEDAEALKLFLFCIIKANYKETEYRGILIPRGSFGTTEGMLCMAMNWSSRNTLTEKLKKLHGSIEKESRGNQFSIITVINYETYQKAFSENQQPTEQPTDGRAEQPTEQPTDQQKKNSNKDKKPKEGQELSSRDVQFGRFWDAYPAGRKTGKAKAAEAFAKVVRNGADTEAIIAAAIEYAASPTGQGRFVKGPVPWLNAGCWDDDRSAWQRGDDGPVAASGSATRSQQNMLALEELVRENREADHAIE